jgi:hypothetical protein
MNLPLEIYLHGKLYNRRKVMQTNNFEDTDISENKPP